MILKINYILQNSKVQGPGNRFTIWVQGCSLHCSGCSNTDTWPFDAGRPVDINQLSTHIIESGADGLTLTGGEPLDQFDPVLKLVQKVFKFKNIFLCSGYNYRIIQKKYKEILGFIDILCAGPFDENQVCQSKWKGSSNQQIIYLTQRGKLVKDLPVYKREYRINKHTGETLLTGFSI
jgi:anaerobic ribonucleoside-triphosphate reductase activating protein